MKILTRKAGILLHTGRNKNILWLPALFMSASRNETTKWSPCEILSNFPRQAAASRLLPMVRRRADYNKIIFPDYCPRAHWSLRSWLLNPRPGGVCLLRDWWEGTIFAPPLVSPKLLDESTKFKRRSKVLSNLSRELQFH